MLENICSKMSDYSCPWWVAGGWAIDLHLGRQHRSHKDVDLAVLRRDQRELRACFSAWSLHKIVSGVSDSWRTNETLELPIHEVHATRSDDNLEFLLNEAEGDTWLFRRNRNVSMPLDRVTRLSSDDIPYLCPEIVLLYKAKDPRPYDNEDFHRTWPALSAHATQWLSAALNICHPGHPWTIDLNQAKSR